MINTDMRSYEYYTFDQRNEYGQLTLSTYPTGTIKIAIYTTSQSIQDNILYTDASYIGLTHDANVSDTFVIDYQGQKLKVLYIQPKGKYKQVFLGKMNNVGKN